ncbi:MAG TPA: KH domain-containing protein [Candidatus Bathyarchaeia archaeon]|nr:KH domain-containing protein [Candidatus Bathyarchaeia archaeon]
MDDNYPDMELSNFLVVIPQNRIGALIGPDGRIKQRLEELASVELDIDSKSGEVIISSKENMSDPFLAIKARDFVHAVGRGFNPEVAFILLEEDIYLEIVNLKTIIGVNPNKLDRFRGRIIGREGRTRQVIEETTGTKISVFGNTVGIIGQYERLRVAKDAIFMLLEGAKHGTVYAYLEEKAQMFRRDAQELWEKASRDLKR